MKCIIPCAILINVHAALSALVELHIMLADGHKDQLSCVLSVTEYMYTYSYLNVITLMYNYYIHMPGSLPVILIYTIVSLKHQY